MIGKMLRLTAALCLLANLLAGCGFKDIDKRFFVVAMGIDKPKDNTKGFLITLRLAVTSPKIEPGAAITQIETIQAPSIAEAVRLLKSHVDKELDFGHCKLFLLGEAFVKNDFNEALNWLGRRRDVQNVAHLAIGTPDAESIMKINPKTERYPGNTIFLQFGKDGTESSYIVSQFLFDFVRRVGEKGLDPVLPVLRGEENGYVITKLGLLDKTKLVQELNPTETELFNQIVNKYKKSTVRASYKGKILVLSVGSIKSSYKIVQNSDGASTVKMKLGISGIFEEAPMGVYDWNWTTLEKAFNKQIAKKTERLLLKVQKAGVDPFGFGLRYRATHIGSEQTWKDWESIYPNLKFEVKVSVRIDGTGLIR